MAEIMVGESDDAHVVGDAECQVDWCGAFGQFPYVHAECGGLVHVAFGDENYDGDYWLFYKCDRCGDTHSPEREE